MLKTRKPPWEGKRENILIKSYSSAVGLLHVGAALYLCVFVYGNGVRENKNKRDRTRSLNI
jgi:hypothetical protein